MPATREDATLVVRLLSWGSQIGVQEAIRTVMADGFNAGAATHSDQAVQPLLMFGETVATFVKQGVLDRALVDDLFWWEGIWAKVGPAAQRARSELGEPRLFENLQLLVTGP